jgi:hypothetical protein
MPDSDGQFPYRLGAHLARGSDTAFEKALFRWPVICGGSFHGLGTSCALGVVSAGRSPNANWMPSR